MRIQDKEIVLDDDLELPSSRLKRSLTSEDSLISDFIEYLFGQRGRVDRGKNCFSKKHTDLQIFPRQMSLDQSAASQSSSMEEKIGCP